MKKFSGNHTNKEMGVYCILLLDRRETNDMVKLPPQIGRFLCWLGFHDFRVVSKTFGFGTDGVEKDVCRRCGHTITRKA